MVRLAKAFFAAGCAISLSLFTPVAAVASDAPDFKVALTPGAPDAGRRIPWLDVEIRIDGLNVDAGSPLFRLPLVADNVQGVADQLALLTASDAAGPLSLRSQDDPEDGMTWYRRWVPTRAVEGTVVIQYRVPISNAPNARGAAPPRELRSEDGSLSGQGEVFIMRPDIEGSRYDVDVQWDFGATKDVGSVSSFGPGDTHLRDVELSTLENTFFMAGSIGRYPAITPTEGFFAAWQGQPPFDPAATMRWTSALYSDYLAFFQEEGNPPYGVFLRLNPVNPGGGVALDRAFVATFDDKTAVEELELTLAHEMLHTFVGGLDDGDGDSSSWWSEGLATHYQRLLPYRMGHLGADEFLKDVNATAARYYTNALNGTPNDQIAERFWAETRVRVLPYDRGSLYFAVLDERIRTRSEGKRSLDDLLITALQHRRSGGLITHAYWRELISAELGEAGLAEEQAMLDGALVLPSSEAFGPCFERVTRPLRRYELGFDSEVLIESPRIVRGLLSGSAAALAGIRDGDEILQPVGQDGLQGDQTGLLTLNLRRGNDVFAVTYLPRGDTVPTYQWAYRRGAGATCTPDRGVS